MRKKYIQLFPLILSTLCFIFLVAWGLITNFVQYKANCKYECFFHFGETQSALITGIYYQYWQNAHYFLQEYPLYGDKLDFFLRPSLFYTHNLNIGAFIIFFFSKLGFSTIVGPAIFTIFFYSLGIYLGHRFCELATKSKLISNWFCFFMATDVLYNLTSGMNLIRGYHWFALFGVLLSTIELSNKISFRFLFLLFISSFVCFFIGYEYSLIVLSIAVVTTAFYGTSLRNKLQISFLLIGTFLLFFITRQFHLIYALGFDIWKNDFIYTFGLKLPSELRFFYIPSEDEISLFYKNNYLGRGGTRLYSLSDSGLYNLLSQLATWKHIYTFLPLLFGGLISGCILLRGQNKALQKISFSKLRILTVFSIGLIFPMLIFFEHIWGYFFRMGMPFLTVPIYLVQAICIFFISIFLNPSLKKLFYFFIITTWSFQQIHNWNLFSPEIYPVLINIKPFGYALPSE